MILGQLLHAILVSALLAAGASCLVPLLRSVRRPTRHLWFGTLLLAALWPLLQRGFDSLRAEPADVPTLGARLLEPIVVGAAERSLGWTQIAANAAELALAAWAAVSALLLLRLAAGMIRLARERATWDTAQVDGYAVRIAPDAGPAVVGLRRMEIVVPRWIMSLDPALRLLALRHEEEHRLARDPLLLLAGALVVSLLPWNLPLWWIVRRLRLAIELDCDARVLGYHPNAARYGRLLLLFAQRPRVPRPLAPALSESITDLQRRIDAMSTRCTLSRRRGALLGAVTSVLIGAACSLRAPTNATNIGAAVPPTSQDVVVKTSDGPKVMDANQTYFEFQVEKPAGIVKSVPPRYPADLRAAGVEGEVLVQFVVDTLGRVEPSSVKVIESNHGGFSAAATAALSEIEFGPATIGGRKVRQLVQMPFQFKLEPGARKQLREFTVEKPARPAATVAPLYPPELRAAGIEGEVVAMFVVDTTGRADVGSFKVVHSTDEAFTRAVRAALPGMTFHPAEVAGRKVRQLLEMPFKFSLSK